MEKTDDNYFENIYDMLKIMTPTRRKVSIISESKDELLNSKNQLLEISLYNKLNCTRQPTIIRKTRCQMN